MKKIAVAAALAAAFVSSGASAATVVSESFSGGFGAFTPTGNVAVANGATYGPCCGTPASYTNNFVAFGGGNVPSGSIDASFATILGQLYTVTFDYGALGGGSEPLIFTVGGTTATYNPVANNNLPAGILSGSFTFFGTGTPTTLSITSGGFNNVDALVDNVTVTTVPEPAIWGLMILGFGAVGVGLRRRRAAHAFA